MLLGIAFEPVRVDLRHANAGAVGEVRRHQAQRLRDRHLRAYDVRVSLDPRALGSKMA